MNIKKSLRREQRHKRDSGKHGSWTESENRDRERRKSIKKKNDVKRKEQEREPYE